MLLLLAPALAHSPHDVAGFVAVGDDGVVLSADTELLAWTTDAGATFAFRHLPGGQPVCGVAWSASRFAAAADGGGLWATTDGGGTLAAVDGPATPTACARSGATAYVGGVEGVWAADDPLDWRPLAPLPAAVRHLGADGERLVVLLADDSLLEWDGAAWVALPDPPVRPWRVAPDGAATVIATVDGGLFRHDGAWAAVEGSPLGVQALAVEGDTWLAATASEGVWATEDGGATWALYDEAFDPLAQGPGSPGDGVHFLGLALHQGTWWSAQWEGLWSRAPGDDRWHQAALDTTPRVRTLQGLTDGSVLVGAYGGGVYRTTPGALDARLVSAGIGWPYPKQILAVDDSTWLVLSGSTLSITRDAGATWAEAPIAADEVGDHVVTAGDTWIAAARKDDRAAVAVSADAGSTWTVAPLPGTCGEKPAAAAFAGDTAWIACGTRGELSRSDDGGATWVATGQLDGNVHALLAGDPLLLATERGVYATVDGAAFTLVALDGRAVDRLVRAPDGGLWAAVADEGVGRVDGDTFVPLGWPTLDRIEALGVAPDGALLAGGRSGAFHRAEGEGFELLTGYDWADDAVQRWWFDGGWERVDDDGFAGGAGRYGGAGATAELSLVGEQARVHAASAGGARFTVAVDGGAAETVSVPVGTDRPIEVWAADLPPGAHLVTLTVTHGHLVIDGATLWRTPGPPLAEPDSADTGARPTGPEGCGCASGKGAAAGLPLVLLVLGRRRGAQRQISAPQASVLSVSSHSETSDSAGSAPPSTSISRS